MTTYTYEHSTNNVTVTVDALDLDEANELLGQVVIDPSAFNLIDVQDDEDIPVENCTD